MPPHRRAVRAFVGAGVLATWVALSGLAFSPVAGAAGCPNEAFRFGPSSALPGCRAYEMVSPADKNGGSVNSVFSVHVPASGGAASFYSSSAFAGAPSSSLANAYIARRGANWTTEALDPPQLNLEGTLIAPTKAGSPDLSRSLGASQLALTPGAIEGGSNLYLRENATGALSLIGATSGIENFRLAAGQSLGSYVGGTSNWSHVAFLTKNEPLPPGPGEPEGAKPAEGEFLPIQNMYDFTGGRARLVNVLPGGIAAPEGVQVPFAAVANRHTVSADGSKIFFETGRFGGGPLYVRENDTTTTPVSISHHGVEAGEVKPAEFGVASADGSLVYFTSTSDLLETSNNEGTPQLYRYDTATKTTTEPIASPGPGGPQISAILGASEDGSFVYFTSPKVLAAPASEAVGLETNLYVWHEGTIKFIAQTKEGAFEFAFPNQWSISPDGRHFAFASYAPISPDDVQSPNCPATPAGNPEGACRDVYTFDYEGGVVSCASCAGSEPGRGDSSLGGQEFHESGLPDEYPRAVLDDGTVFVDSPNRLLPRDANGVGDVYAWRGGSYELVSTGLSDQPSTFADATPSGSEIFFRTTQKLVGQDTDENVDLYDDREDGGLASQRGATETPPPPCEAEGCRGAPASPPAGLASGSKVATAGACGEERAVARAARRHAKALRRRARKAAKRHGAGAKARARHLRRQATAARKRANRLQNKAKNCGGSK